MDGLGRSVGDGISSLVATAFSVIGGTLRSMVDAASNAVPYGLFPVVVFIVLLGGAWVLAKR